MTSLLPLVSAWLCVKPGHRYHPGLLPHRRDIATCGVTRVACLGYFFSWSCYTIVGPSLPGLGTSVSGQWAAPDSPLGRFVSWL